MKYIFIGIWFALVFVVYVITQVIVFLILFKIWKISFIQFYKGQFDPSNDWKYNERSSW